MRILIVDDEPLNVTILTTLLSDDYALDVAASGEEALSKAASFDPHLILLDLMMPGIDGYETCRRMRADASLRHMKIILVSARAMHDEQQAGYEAGADDYITKPFDCDDLEAKIRQELQGQSESA